jgi:hypothetical protein
MLYSFAKEDRFKKLKVAGSDVMYYPLPDLNKKQPVKCDKFGFGKRSDFTQGAKGKCPQFYNIKSEFEDKKSGQPKYTFGISRHHYEKVFNEVSDDYHDKSFPGPGAYPILKEFGHGAKKFSMASKLESKNLSKAANKIPGPGEYVTMSKLGGKQLFSKYKSTTNVIWSVDKSPRFNYDDKNKVPGPEKYEVKPLINEKGQIFVSKYKSSPGKTMGSKYYENPQKKMNNVGPGSYRMYSDFGIYESKNKDTFMEKEKEKMASTVPKKE